MRTTTIFFMRSEILRKATKKSTTINITKSAISNNINFIRKMSDDVLFRNENLARIITLNRPEKLNSLNTSMVTKITPRLLEISKSNVNNLVIMTSSSPKGLCAGGDVAECARQILQGNPQYGSNFFQEEYNLNYLIGTFSKPYIALMDGITMGGGVGLSVHAPFRVATERTKLAMPEMDIGFFPDVGTTFFLPRLDDKIGYYYALTGEIIDGITAYLTGFATHYIHSERIPQVINRLSNLQPPILNGEPSSELSNQKQYYQQVNEILEEFTDNKLPANTKYPFTAKELSVLNQAFSKPTFEDVIGYLQSESSEFSHKLLEKLATKSPTSLRVGYALLNKGINNTFKTQLALELTTATNMMNTPLESNDFVKGVKHKLIDKIKQPPLPQWTQPPNDVAKLMKSSLAVAKLNRPLINRFFNVDYKQYPFAMGLPNNLQIKSFISGAETNKSYLPTTQEVRNHFKHKCGDKPGLELKINSVLELHGDLDTYQGKYASWKD